MAIMMESIKMGKGKG